MHLGNTVALSSIYTCLLAGRYDGVNIHMIMCLCGLHIRTRKTDYRIFSWFMVINTSSLHVDLLTGSGDSLRTSYQVLLQN